MANPFDNISEKNIKKIIQLIEGLTIFLKRISKRLFN